MTEHAQPSPALHEGCSINRRQALLGLGGAGIAALLAACGTDSKSGDTAAGSNSSSTGGTSGGDVAAPLDAAGSCTVVPELTEGPYYIDVDAMRSDIREDQQGTALQLAIRVRDLTACTPKANAVVDI